MGTGNRYSPITFSGRRLVARMLSPGHSASSSKTRALRRARARNCRVRAIHAVRQCWWTARAPQFGRLGQRRQSQRRPRVIATTGSEHASGLAYGDHRILDVIQAPEIGNLREHSIAEWQHPHVCANTGRYGLLASCVCDESSPIQLTAGLRREAKRPSPQPTSRTGPVSSGATIS